MRTPLFGNLNTYTQHSQNGIVRHQKQKKNVIYIYIYVRRDNIMYTNTHKIDCLITHTKKIHDANI